VLRACFADSAVITIINDKQIQNPGNPGLQEALAATVAGVYY